MSKDTADRRDAASRAATEGADDATAAAASEVRQGRDNLRVFDLPAFIRARRELRGVVSLGELTRLFEELPTDAPADARDGSVSWFVRGETRREVRREAPGSGKGGAPTTSSHTLSQPYLTLEAHGRTWLECQRCMKALAFPIDIDTVYRVMDTEAEADAIALDDSEIEVIVGSTNFDLIDLIDEEIVLSLPMVPKHDLCPAVHESVVSGADGSLGVENIAALDARLAAEDTVGMPEDGVPEVGGTAADKIEASKAAGVGRSNGHAGTGRPNPFAALAGLRATLASDDDKKQ